MIATLKPVNLPLGSIVATPGVLEVLKKSNQSPSEFLAKHKHGDWGIIGGEDWTANDESIKDGRILSAYKTKTDIKIWIITERDRSSTCILLPEEY